MVGSILWESHSTGHFGDDDYSWYLTPPNGNGLTATRTALEPEFKAAETIDHFSTPWWTDFHTAVDMGGTGPNTMVDGKLAIVSGLFSLDFEHSVHAEVHPVFAMAIRVKDNDPNDETWVVFARRYGNEGFCASGMHYLDYLPANQFIFRLPLLWGANATLSSQDSTFLAEIGNPPTPPITFVPGQGVLVTFSLPENPAARQLIHGEIHLHWTNAGPAIRRAPVTVTRAESEELEGALPGTEGFYKNLVDKMTPAQKNQLSQMVPVPRPAARSAVHLNATHTVTQAATRPVYRAGTRHPSVSSVPDPEKIQSDKLLVESIHKVTQIPLPPQRQIPGRPPILVP